MTRWRLGCVIGLLGMLFFQGLVLAAGDGSMVTDRLASQTRKALVIGNDRYTDVTVLRNARNDAESMARELTAAGFVVTRELDADRKTLFAAVDAFVQGLRKNDEVVFYFSGHGVQIGPAAYLLPTDIGAESDRQVSRNGLALDQLVEDLSKARYALVVVDACRDNPFPKTSTKSIGTGRGLQPVEAPEGVAILMAAGRGQTALDRLSKSDPDPNGLFTRQLIKHMKTPGLPIRDMLLEVRDEVESLAATINHKQRPALVDESRGQFYFYPPRGGTQTASLVPVPATSNDPEAAGPGPRKSFKDCADCPEMVVIPAGSFNMGSPSGEAGRIDAEGPQHRVSVSTFALAKTHVTRGQFAAFVKETGYQADDSCWVYERGGYWYKRQGRNWKDPGYPQQDSHPVVCLNWNDAKAYTEWLSRKTGKRYRLPTESEWEYAARAGTATARYWGESPDQACSYANVMDSTGKARVLGVTGGAHNCTDGYAYTAPVASFKANAFGLYDMIGNTWEWVEDCYHDNYKGAPTDGSAWTGGECKSRVRRGGAWYDEPQDARSAKRNRYTPEDRGDYNGFRPARMLP